MPTIPKHVHEAAQRILAAVPGSVAHPQAEAMRDDLTRILYRYHRELYVTAHFDQQRTKASFAVLMDRVLAGLADGDWRERAAQDPAS